MIFFKIRWKNQEIVQLQTYVPTLYCYCNMYDDVTVEYGYDVVILRNIFKSIVGNPSYISHNRGNQCMNDAGWIVQKSFYVHGITKVCLFGLRKFLGTYVGACWALEGNEFLYSQNLFFDCLFWSVISCE